MILLRQITQHINKKGITAVLSTDFQNLGSRSICITNRLEKTEKSKPFRDLNDISLK